MVAKALSVLAAFDRDRLVLTLPELALRTGIPQTTVYRHATDLVRWGALDRSPGGGYQIGLRMVEIAALCPRGQQLRDVALPYLEDLYEATHQNVQLAVRDGAEVVYVEFLSARNAVAVHIRVGARWPLHATGVGLAILAYAPDDEVEEILRGPLRSFTDKTIHTASRLRQELAQVRRTGVAVSEGQVTLDAYSVAAPVFGADRKVVAAVSVVVPSDDTRRWVWAPAVQTAALGITRQLGGRPPASFSPP
ncbi:IclR family transcriptional regulator [Nocardia sp. CA2R105]|nr:IclR family transcriptional regulator [Nocardia coffeae]